MPMIVVRDERSLPALNRRMLRRGTPPEEVERLHRRITRENPELDLDDLRPGVVVRLPDSPHLRVRPESTSSDAVGEGLEGVRSAAAADIESRTARAREQLTADARERRAVAKQLGGRRIAGVLRKHPELVPIVTEAREALADDAEEDQRRAEVIAEVASQWSADLEVLKRLRR